RRFWGTCSPMPRVHDRSTNENTLMSRCWRSWLHALSGGCGCTTSERAAMRWRWPPGSPRRAAAGVRRRECAGASRYTGLAGARPALDDRAGTGLAGARPALDDRAGTGLAGARPALDDQSGGGSMTDELAVTGIE